MAYLAHYFDEMTSTARHRHKPARSKSTRELIVAREMSPSHRLDGYCRVDAKRAIIHRASAAIVNRVMKAGIACAVVVRSSIARGRHHETAPEHIDETSAPRSHALVRPGDDDAARPRIMHNAHRISTPRRPAGKWPGPMRMSEP